MYRKLFFCLLLIYANGEKKETKCNNDVPLLANTKGEQLNIGSGETNIEQNFECEWTVQPAPSENGKIVISVVKKAARTPDKQCVKVTTEPPPKSESTDRKATTLCASDENPTFESTKSPVYLIYPGKEKNADVKPFQVSYKLDTTPLTTECGPQADLLAEKDPKQFDIGNGAQDLGNGYSCEWKIKTADSNAGKIKISVVASTNGNHEKECVEVTTIAPDQSGATERKPTKLCAKGEVSQFETTESTVYVIYSSKDTDTVNKPFKVSYQLVTGNTPVTGKCAAQADLMADSTVKQIDIGNGAQEIGTGYSCDWTIKPAEGKAGKVVISVVGSTGGTHTNECVDVTTVPATQTGTANRNAQKVCAQGETTNVTLETSPVYILYPSGKMDSKNKPFRISYQLNSSSRLNFPNLIYLFAVVGLFLQQS